MPSGSTI